LRYTLRTISGAFSISSINTNPSQPDSSFFSVFSNTQFRWLFFGNVAFFFAMQGQILTRTLLAWELTGEAISLAYINLIAAIPMIFASILGGAITDRVEHRQLIIVGQCITVANEVFILGLLLSGRLEFWHILCTSFVGGCAYPFIMPARMAITATIVGPQNLQSALGFTNGAINLTRVLGPAAMGVIIAMSSFSTAYMLSTILYISAIFCMFGIERSHSGKVGDEKKPLLADIAQGFSYVRQNRPVLICMAFGLLPMFLAMPFQNILVMMAEQSWGVDESGVGTLMAVGGTGGVIGSIWIVKRGHHASRLKLMLGSTVAFGVFLGLFSQTSSFYLALLPLLLAYVFASASQTVNNAAVQLLVDDAVRGRMSSFMMLSFALMPIGVVPMAIAADKIGAASAIGGASVILILLTAVFYFASPTLRGLDNSVVAAMKAKEKNGGQSKNTVVS
jgi:predicted MFS family arabinose efflux permease